MSLKTKFIKRTFFLTKPARTDKLITTWSRAGERKANPVHLDVAES